MDNKAELLAIMLSELPYVGDATAARILAINRQRRRTLEGFFRLAEATLREDYDLHAETIRRIVGDRSAHEVHCRWLLDRLAQSNGEVLFVQDERYPDALRRRLSPSPVAVYACGERAVLAAPKMAVLSSRDLNEQSVAATLAIVQNAAAQGFTTVGGGMKATYRIAAVASRAAEAKRVIVLDRGLFATFGAEVQQDPFGFGPGRSPLRREQNLVLSPFRLMNHAAAHNGRQRDACVAALADVIVAVHARPGGEIERQCLAALDRGQCVLSWYGENPGLVAAGASVIESTDLPNLARYTAPRCHPTFDDS